jgi:hypothetical protein
MQTFILESGRGVVKNFLLHINAIVATTCYSESFTVIPSEARNHALIGPKLEEAEVETFLTP